MSTISAYRAEVDPAKVGLNFAATVFVTLREGSRDKVQEFENAVGGSPKSCRRNACSVTLIISFTYSLAT